VTLDIASLEEIKSLRSDEESKAIAERSLSGPKA